MKTWKNLLDRRTVFGYSELKSLIQGAVKLQNIIEYVLEVTDYNSYFVY